MLRGSKGKGTEETGIHQREVLRIQTLGEFGSSLVTFDFSLKCKDGVVETAEWMSKTEYPYNMHFYTLRTSDYNSHIDATDEDRAKAESASKSVLFDMESAWRELLGFGGMASQKVRDKDIARLDRIGLKGMCVRVGKSDGYLYSESPCSYRWLHLIYLHLPRRLNLYRHWISTSFHWIL